MNIINLFAALRAQTAVAATTAGCAVSVLYGDEMVTYEDGQPTARFMRGGPVEIATSSQTPTMNAQGDFEAMATTGTVIAHDGNFDLVLRDGLIDAVAVNPECRTTAWGNVELLARRIGYGDRLVDCLTDAGRAVLSGMVVPIYWSSGKLIKGRYFLPAQPSA